MFSFESHVPTTEFQFDAQRVSCFCCGDRATTVRDDDVAFCLPCSEEDDSGLCWWPLGSRSFVFGS